MSSWSHSYQLHAVQITAVIIFKINSENVQNKVSLVFKEVSRKYSSCKLYNGPHLQLQLHFSNHDPPHAHVKVNSL